MRIVHREEWVRMWTTSRKLESLGFIEGMTLLALLADVKELKERFRQQEAERRAERRKERQEEKR